MRVYFQGGQEILSNSFQNDDCGVWVATQDQYVHNTFRTSVSGRDHQSPTTSTHPWPPQFHADAHQLHRCCQGQMPEVASTPEGAHGELPPSSLRGLEHLSNLMVVFPMAGGLRQGSVHGGHKRRHATCSEPGCISWWAISLDIDT
jgi:hypothetical protein